jgi:triosephosphate isomerase (TIM)
MKKLVVGNWKMNSDAQSCVSLISNITESNTVDVVICPPFPYLSIVKTTLLLGAQNCSAFENGAYTGEISAKMLSDIGCKYVILGHSERRQHFKENDSEILAKAKIAHKYGLKTIICIGESLETYQSGKTEEFVSAQLNNYLDLDAALTIIAYEPIWAIGTGLTPTVAEVETITKSIKQQSKFPVLYGGSVNQKNCKDFANIKAVDGFLVGGASLDPTQFNQITSSFA